MKEVTLSIEGRRAKSTSEVVFLGFPLKMLYFKRKSSIWELKTKTISKGKFPLDFLDLSVFSRYWFLRTMEKQSFSFYQGGLR